MAKVWVALPEKLSEAFSKQTHFMLLQIQKILSSSTKHEKKDVGPLLCLIVLSCLKYTVYYRSNEYVTNDHDKQQVENKVLN